MRSDNHQIRVNRFSIVDVIIDALLVGTTFAVPIRMPHLVSLKSGFLPNLAMLGLLFIGYFGLALYVALMYYATASKRDHSWTFFPTGSLLLLTCIILIKYTFFSL
jgi:hypothetical protein